MDPNGLSALSHLRAKPVGKVRRRVRELRTTAAATYYGGGGGGGLPTLDLSHSESQRLAVDALLGEGGVPGYLQLLATEGEVDFLSEQEKSYILTNRQDGHVGRESDAVDGEEELGGSQQCGGPLSLGHFSASEESCSLHSVGQNGVEQSGLDRQGQSRVEVFLRSDNREGSMKDLIREEIRKTQTALVVVVDTFSDVELLCDILEASTKRNVCVYLLLDRLNVQQFLVMCLDLNVDGKHFPKLSVRIVAGHGYCAKTGRKLPGQITETFIISDWTRVLTGSYSFSWLSWQVDRNFIVLLQGGSVTSFHQEFRRLYLSSQPLHAALTPTASASRVGQNTASDSVMESMLNGRRRGCDGTKERKREIPTDMEPVHLALSRLEVEHNRAEKYVMTLAQCHAQTQAEPPAPRERETAQRLRVVSVGRSLSDVNASAAGRQTRALRAYASEAPPAASAGLAFSRAYAHNTAGADARRAHGPPTLKTHMNPRARGKPTAVGGLLYQDLDRNSRAAAECGTAAANLDALRRVQWNDSKANARPNIDSQPLRRSPSPQTHIQGNAQDLYMRTQRRWLVAQLSPQNGACRTLSPKGLVSSPTHLWPAAASKDLKSQVKPQLESGFPVAGTKATSQDPQQFAPSQRLQRISQLHMSGANGTAGRRNVEELGQRDGRSGASALVGGRTNGTLGRPAILHRGATLGARLTESGSRCLRGQQGV